MKDSFSREAFFRSVVAFASPSLQAVCFIGEIHGRIAMSPRGSGGFGFDSIFVPEGGDGRTFGEMSLLEKNRFSHRAFSVKKFAKWYIEQKFDG